jgi:uncharacterized protein (DUF885 family)
VSKVPVVLKNSAARAVALVGVIGLFGVSCNKQSPADSPDDGYNLEQLLDTVYQRRVAANPVLASRLGANSVTAPWYDLSMAAWDREYQQTQGDLEALTTQVDVEALNPAQRTNYLAFEADLMLRLERYHWRFHLNPINQIVGPHLTIAGTLLNSHPIDSIADARFYINRLQSAHIPLQQLVDHLHARRERGFFIPSKVAERLIDGAKSIIAGGENGGVILADFEKKLSGLELGEEQRARLIDEAKTAYREGFVPGYELLIDDLKQEKARANPGGVWAMPQGAAFYEFLIDQYTTADFSGQQIHSLGLAEVARIQAKMDAIRQRLMFAGDLGAFFAHLKTDPALYFPNTDEGRANYLQLAQSLVDKAEATMIQVLPYPVPHKLKVRRIEAFREKSAPIGFYESGSVENDFVGTIYLGMHDMSSLATYDLPALLFHEGLPGHHLQSSLMLSREIPQIRKYYVWWSNAAFTEGWALYAEYLAAELGLYEDDYAEFGRLAGELWRACRLVVDSGLHLKQWSREEAIDYLNENTASSEENNARAVDRYLAVPGQATAFKIGMQVILDLRAEAEQRMGSEFDLASFHARVLESGPLPLSLLRDQLEAWMAVDSTTATP